MSGRGRLYRVSSNLALPLRARELRLDGRQSQNWPRESRRDLRTLRGHRAGSAKTRGASARAFRVIVLSPALVEQCSDESH